MGAILDMFRGQAGGKFSAMRVMSLGTVGVVLGVYIAHNVVSMIHGNGYVAMSWQDVTLICSALSLKMAQAPFEKAIPPQTTNDVPTGKTE